MEVLEITRDEAVDHPSRLFDGKVFELVLFHLREPSSHLRFELPLVHSRIDVHLRRIEIAGILMVTPGG